MKHPILFLIASSTALVVAQSGSGYTTRFWDCCKPTCAFNESVPLVNPVGSCAVNDNVLSDLNAADGCNGGTGFMCSTFQPWGVTADLAYGFAAANLLNNKDTCCSCYKLTFTDGGVKGKSMIVQAISSSYNNADNQFDIYIPGGGVAGTKGCARQYGDISKWGAEFGGVTDRDACAALPQKLRGGCNWRFDWLKSTDNPSVTFSKVSCPKELTDISGCRRVDDGGTPIVTPGLVHGAQCGGRTYSGSTKCSGNLQCVFITNDMYRCLNPGETSFSTVTSTTVITARPTATGSTTATRVPATTSNPIPAGQVSVWNQCGGLLYFGSNRCTTGNNCVSMNFWYWQCQPVGFVPATNPTGMVASWNQCGGQGYIGVTKCVADSTCTWLTLWYSQCVPNNWKGNG